MTRILILNTGGTIAMTGLDAHPFYTGEELYMGIHKPMGIRLGFKAYNSLMDSTNLQHEDRGTIADILRLEYDKHDAFVILHGSDTLDLTSAYLCMAFDNTLQKPLFVIASAKKPDDVDTDAKQQLRDALVMADVFARSGYVGVYAISAGKVLDGSRVCKRLDAGDDLFYTPGLAPVAEVGSLTCYPHLLRHRDEKVASQGLSTMRLKLEREVVTLEVSADASPFVLKTLCVANAVRGVILIGKGEGNIPDRLFRSWSENKPISWLDAIKDAVTRGIPVGIRSAFEGAEFDMQRYDLGKKALKAGAVSLSGLTPAMADVLFRHLTARYGHGSTVIQKYLDDHPIGKLPTTKQAAA